MSVFVMRFLRIFLPARCLSNYHYYFKEIGSRLMSTDETPGRFDEDGRTLTRSLIETCALLTSTVARNNTMTAREEWVLQRWWCLVGMSWLHSDVLDMAMEGQYLSSVANPIGMFEEFYYCRSADRLKKRYDKR